jgi:hypothetical protein
MRIASPVLPSACLAIAAGSLWASVYSARASVAVCERSHSGEAAEDSSELAAKKRAIENWVAHASRHGAQFGRWGIAWNRRLECRAATSGSIGARPRAILA